MTRQQEKLFNMLIRFHNICENNNLTYYLIGHQLLFAAQNDSMHGYEVDIAMHDKDWKKLCAYIEKIDDIEIESIVDGGKMPGCYFRFVNNKTTLLDMDYYGVYSKPGIAINICILRSNRKIAQLLSQVERGLSYRAKFPHRRFSKVFSYIENIIKKEKLATFLDKLEKKSRSKSLASPSIVKEPYARGRNFPLDFWKKRVKISFMGFQFYTVERYEDYLKKRFGKKWPQRKATNAKETYRCMFSTTIPYRTYLSELEKTNIVTDDFLIRFRRFINGYKEYEKMLKKEKVYWNKTMFAASERFRLWKKYMPMKDEVLSLYEEGRYDEIEIILDDYLTTMKKYLDFKIVICFDKDYLDVVKGLYEANGQMKMVAIIDKNVLPEDLEPIVI